MSSFLYAFIANEKVVAHIKTVSRTIFHNCMYKSWIKWKMVEKNGQKNSTLPFAHKLHPIVSLDDVFLEFLSIFLLRTLLLAFMTSFFISKKQTRNINTWIVFVSVIETFLFITQNRFKNSVNTFSSHFFSFTLRCCTRRHPQQLPMMFYNEIDTKKIDPENIWYYSIVLRSVLSLNVFVFLYIYLCYIERLPLIDQWNSKYLNWKIKRRINKISKRESVRRSESCFPVTKIHFVGVDV